jgi:hypothetical protein
MHSAAQDGMYSTLFVVHVRMPDTMSCPHHVHLQVRVTEIIANTYYARVHVSRAGEPPHEVDVDARPSDAINLAVRFGAPVYISKKIAGARGPAGLLGSWLLQDSAKAQLDCVHASGSHSSLHQAVL